MAAAPVRLPGPLVLASASPRRHQLLGAAGFEFVVRPADLDETPRDGEAPLPYVERLAVDKALAVARPGEVVVASDTTVDLDGEILSKPVDEADASAMLRRLSGRSHVVHTGVAVVFAGSQVISTSTLVEFAELTDAQIEWYVGTGEPADKAGAYAIQGSGAMFVTRIEGSASSIVGLPVSETVALLQALRPEDR